MVPQYECLKTTHVYYLTVSVVKNPGKAHLSSVFQSFSLAAIMGSVGAAVSSEGSTGEEPTSVLNSIAVGRMQFLEAYWSEILIPCWLLDGAG